MAQICFFQVLKRAGDGPEGIPVECRSPQAENNWRGVGVENPNEFGILAEKNVENGRRVPNELWLPVFQLFPVPLFAKVPRPSVGQRFSFAKRRSSLLSLYGPT